MTRYNRAYKKLKNNIVNEGYLLERDIPRLVKHVKKPVLKLLTRVLAYTGRRVSEALLLKPSDVLKDEKRIRWNILKKNVLIKKCINCENKVISNKVREEDRMRTEYYCNNCNHFYNTYRAVKPEKKYVMEVPVIDDKIINWILGYARVMNVEPDEYVFKSGYKRERDIPVDCKGDKPYSRGRVYQVVHAAGEALGKDVHPHTLRHTFGIMVAKRGLPPLIIKKLLCHENLKTTEVYLDIAQVDVDRAVRDVDINI